MTTRSGFIAIVGRPNAGKSTLLNSILGADVSIVTAKAQTTRERVLGILTEEQGQIIFVDTPGIHRAKEGGINAYMMREAAEALDAPTLVWYLVDPHSALKHEEAVLEMLEKSGAPVAMIFNKSDLLRGVGARDRLSVFEKEVEDAARSRNIPIHSIRRISADRGKGVTELLDDSWKALPPGPLYYPDSEQLSDRPTRFFVAEKVREQLLLQLGEELPYSCAVEIEKFVEAKAEGEIHRIEATIHVERDSQKGMVIGKGGQKIKEIGQAARMEIEKFLSARIFLGLQVKVLKEWTRDAAALKRMGYHLPPGNPRKSKSSVKSAQTPTVSESDRKIS